MKTGKNYFFGWKAGGTITVHAESLEEAEAKATNSIDQLITADVGSVSVAKTRVNFISAGPEGEQFP